MKHLNYKVAEVKYLDNYRLLLTFDNGEQKIFDMEPELWGELFEPLKDIALFRQVSIDHGALKWPNDADICYDKLYRDSVSAKEKIA